MLGGWHLSKIQIKKGAKNGFLFQKLKNLMYNKTMEVTVLIHMLSPHQHRLSSLTEKVQSTWNTHTSLGRAPCFRPATWPVWSARCGQPAVAGGEADLPEQQGSSDFHFWNSSINTPWTHPTSTSLRHSATIRLPLGASKIKRRENVVYSVMLQSRCPLTDLKMSPVLFPRYPRCSAPPQKTKSKVKQCYNEDNIMQRPVLTVPSSVSLT